MNTADQAGTTAEKPANQEKPALCILVGGFLGAGKTTAVARLGVHLARQGMRVGLITNDLGGELADTVALRAGGFATEQVAGGCFGSQFHALTDAAQRLTAVDQSEVFIAEAAGSCADLAATVSYPLRRLHGARYAVAPLSVLVDPARAARVFGLAPGIRFSEQVDYLYRKQLEEADLLVINKSDAVTPEALTALRRLLEKEFPAAGLVEMSARTGQGLEGWFAAVLGSRPSSRPAITLDYERYAAGLARLGWLNCAVRLSAIKGFEANTALRELAARIQTELREEGVEIAHLKMTLSPEADLGGIASASLVGNDFAPETGKPLPEPVEDGRLILNLRAEGEPELLHTVVTRALTQTAGALPGLFARLEQMEHFRPATPKPTHRLET